MYIRDDDRKFLLIVLVVIRLTEFVLLVLDSWLEDPIWITYAEF